MSITYPALNHACHSYAAAPGAHATELSLSCHFLLAIVTFANQLCNGTATVPIPRSLVCALYRILFEVPLRNAREASVDFKGKFCTSKNVAKSCGRYELTGVVMGFGKGETSLKDLIRTIDKTWH